MTAAKTAPILRQRYEAVLGRSLCDRQWLRIRSWLGLDGDDLDAVAIVESHARLRLMFPRSHFGVVEAIAYGRFLEEFPLSGSGDDLAQSIRRVFKDRKGRPPSMKTLYRWGNEIKVRLYKHRMYTKAEIAKWVAKALTQGHFKPIYALPPGKAQTSNFAA